MTPWSRVLLVKLIVNQLVKKSSAFYGTWRLITIIFATACHWFLFWARSIHPISLRSILILFSQLCLGPPRGLFPSGFPTKMFYAFSIYPMHATCLIHLILIGFITLIIFGEAQKLWSFSLHSLLHPPATLSLLGTNILLSTMFSNTCNLCSSLTLRDQVSHTYKTKGKIIVMYISIFKFL